MSAGIAEIDDQADLERRLESSSETPLWLFKHSLTCGTSNWALDRFKKFVEARAGEGDGLPGEPVILTVQTARALSNTVATLTGVRHESPQVLLIQEGRVVWHASHWQITVEALEEATGLLSDPVTG